jgi:hypothetical protein
MGVFMNKKQIFDTAIQLGFSRHVAEYYSIELEALVKLVADKATKAEQDRCCAIIFSQFGSDNVAQRTVDAIRGQA